MFSVPVSSGCTSAPGRGIRVDPAWPKWEWKQPLVCTALTLRRVKVEREVWRVESERNALGCCLEYDPIFAWIAVGIAVGIDGFFSSHNVWSADGGRVRRGFEHLYVSEPACGLFPLCTCTQTNRPDGTI